MELWCVFLVAGGGSGVSCLRLGVGGAGGLAGSCSVWEVLVGFFCCWGGGGSGQFFLMCPGMLQRRHFGGALSIMSMHFNFLKGRSVGRSSVVLPGESLNLISRVLLSS